MRVRYVQANDCVLASEQEMELDTATEPKRIALILREVRAFALVHTTLFELNIFLHSEHNPFPINTNLTVQSDGSTLIVVAFQVHSYINSTPLSITIYLV